MAVTLVVRSHASASAQQALSQVPSPAPSAGAGDACSITFEQPRIVIGRGAHADVRLPSRAVSDSHAIVKLDTGELSVTDMGSTNGTKVNGVALPPGRKKVLSLGDTISVPGFDVVLTAATSIPDARDRTATVARKLLADAMQALGEEAAAPSLTLVAYPDASRLGRSWYFGAPPSSFIAGRVESCPIFLDDLDCSRAHADFVRDDAGVLVRDLESKNGLFFAGRKITERRLRDGDVIELGQSALRFNDPSEVLLRSFEGGPDEAPPPAPAFAVAPAPAVDPSLAPATGAGTSIPASGVDALFAPDAKPGASGSASSSGAPELASPSSSGFAPPPRRGGADWIVAVLAVIILGVSAAALYFLVRTTPLTTR